MIRRPPRSTHCISSAASDVYKRQASDHLITEMTYDHESGAMHLSRRDVEGLMARHPKTRFIITHRGSDGEVSGAVMARDFLTLRLPLR